jgi:hypothetical protein
MDFTKFIKILQIKNLNKNPKQGNNKYRLRNLYIYQKSRQKEGAKNGKE